MTDSPKKSKPILYSDPARLSKVFESPAYQNIHDGCKVRRTAHREFSGIVKPGHEGTIEEWGEIHTDSTGLRAIIFYYLHSDGTKIRSIKRLIDAENDYRIQFPSATKQF
jgi:hypothetical protein